MWKLQRKQQEKVIYSELVVKNIVQREIEELIKYYKFWLDRWQRLFENEVYCRNCDNLGAERNWRNCFRMGQ